MKLGQGLLQCDTTLPQSRHKGARFSCDSVGKLWVGRFSHDHSFTIGDLAFAISYLTVVGVGTHVASGEWE